MTILHLLPSRLEAAAGLASAVLGLAEAQSQRGLDARCLGADEVSCLRRGSPLVRCALAELNGAAAVIHSHGLWLASSAASRRLRRRGLGTVVAPHGMLDSWALSRHKLLKQLLWWGGEQRTLQGACCVQALCSAERDAIRRLGISAPVALIPNGVQLPDLSQAACALLPPPPWLDQGVPPGAPVLLFLGRFHAKKGLEPLLRAWQQLQCQAATGSDPPWLVLAGFGDGGALAEQLRQAPLPGVRLVGALHGPIKASAFAHARGFVLPSFSEGLPMAALEAMSWGLPCLLSAACNLPEALAAEATWQAPPDPARLLPVLQRWQQAVRHDPDTLERMGAAGRTLVATQFSWSRVAEQTAALYDWLLGGGPPPAWVDLRG